MLEGLKKANEFIALEPIEAQKVVVQRLGIEQNSISWMWQDYIFKLSLNRALLINLNSQAQWAIDMGLTSIKQPPEYKSFIQRAPLLKVSPHTVSVY